MARDAENGKFLKGESGNPGGVPKRVEEVVSEGPVDLLAEMDAMLSRVSAGDRTDLQKKLRQEYNNDFAGFMDRLVRLRGKEAVTRGKSDAASDLASGPCAECERRKTEAAEVLAAPDAELYRRIIEEAKRG